MCNGGENGIETTTIKIATSETYCTKGRFALLVCENCPLVIRLACKIVSQIRPLMIQ